jgi:hypothetical protein
VLQEIVEQIHSLINKDWSKFEQDEANNLRKELNYYICELMSEIDKVDTTECLERAIRYEHEHFFLPIPCMIKLYQRLVFLNQTNKLYFEGFVDYLLQYGPDWEEEAHTLARLYTNDEFIAASEYAQKVEHYKDFRK